MNIPKKDVKIEVKMFEDMGCYYDNMELIDKVSLVAYCDVRYDGEVSLVLPRYKRIIVTAICDISNNEVSNCKIVDMSYFGREFTENNELEIGIKPYKNALISAHEGEMALYDAIKEQLIDVLTDSTNVYITALNHDGGDMYGENSKEESN